jgi:hypothetical protein
MGTQIAVFTGALVLLTAGAVGLRRRSLAPGRAARVLAVAVAVAGLAWLGSRFPVLYAVGIIVPVTAAGMLMAVAIITARERRIR